MSERETGQLKLKIVTMEIKCPIAKSMRPAITVACVVAFVLLAMLCTMKLSSLKKCTCKTSCNLLTVHAQSDGFGSQYQSILSCVAIASHLQCKYVHMEIKSMEHVQSEEEHQDLIRFMGLNKSVEQYTGRTQKANSRNIKNVRSRLPGLCDPIIINSKQIADANIEILASQKPAMQHFYYKTPKPDVAYCWKNKPGIRIAVHLRRRNQYANRETIQSPQYFQNALKYAVKYASERNSTANVAIFAQRESSYKGKIDSLDWLIGMSVPIKVNWDTPIADTFHAMVVSDVLIISSSSLSYTAALLCNGHVIYTPFWHTAFPEWVSVVDGVDSY